MFLAARPHVHIEGPEDANLGGSAEELAKACNWEYFDTHVDVAWQNMQRLKADGLATEIGVSNFYQQHLDRLTVACATTSVTAGGSSEADLVADGADVVVKGLMPHANQIYIDATHQEDHFVTQMQASGIHVIAYRPTTFLPVAKMAADMGDTTWAVLESAAAELGRQADDGGATPPSVWSVVLRWLIARGVHVLVKSTGDDTSSAGHLKGNLDCKDDGFAASKVCRFIPVMFVSASWCSIQPCGVSFQPRRLSFQPCGVRFNPVGCRFNPQGCRFNPVVFISTPWGYNPVVPFQPRGVSLQPRGVSLQPRGVSFQPRGVSFQPRGFATTRGVSFQT
jgi:hypothetical protein